LFEPPQNSPEQSEDPDRVATSESEPAQEQVEVVPVGIAQVGRRVVGGEHGLLDDPGEEFQIARGGGRIVEWFGLPGPRMRGTRGTQFMGRARSARAEFVKTHSDGLAEIHRRLRRIGGNRGEDLAKREVFACEAALLGAEDEGDAPAARELFLNERREFRQRNNRLLGLAMLERGCAHDQSAVGYRVREALRAFRVLEQVRSADGGLRLAPVFLQGSDDGQALEAEVGHGPRRRSYIEGIARRNEDDGDAVAMGFGEQGIHCSALNPVQSWRRPQGCSSLKNELSQSPIVRFSLLALSSIFFLVDPFAAIPSFLAITESADAAAPQAHGAQGRDHLLHRAHQLRDCGQLIFRMFGITLPAFEIAGGLILLLIGLDMLEARRSPTQETHGDTEEAAAKEDAGIVPLGIPMLAGPGAISSVMVLVGQVPTLWHWQMAAILGSITITAS
jgi:multiple antibiotic resistance protein